MSGGAYMLMQKRREREECHAKVKSFDPNTSTNSQKLDYARCIQLITPEPQAESHEWTALLLLPVLAIFFVVLLAKKIP